MNFTVDVPQSVVTGILAALTYVACALVAAWVCGRKRIPAEVAITVTVFWPLGALAGLGILFYELGRRSEDV